MFSFKNEGELLLGFIFQVVLITSSGVFAPGPLTASAIAMGSDEGWKAGLKMSTGHMVVEFPLILLIAANLAFFLTGSLLRDLISVVGGVLLIVLGYLMVRDTVKEGYGSNSLSNSKDSTFSKIKSPLLTGVLLSALNPYFLIWWVFVGGTLIIQALNLAGSLGIFILFVSHIWMDYFWLIILSTIAEKGRKFFSSKIYSAFLVLISLVIMFYGVKFMYSGLAPYFKLFLP